MQDASGNFGRGTLREGMDMATVQEIRPEDELPVQSRVSWGGIFSGIGTLVGSGPNLVARWGTFVPRTRVVVPPPPPAR